MGIGKIFTKSSRILAVLVVVMASAAWGAINTSGQKGVIRTFSAHSYDYGKMNLLFSIYYAQDNDYVIQAIDTDADTILDMKESPKILSGNLAACYSFSKYIDLSASLPFYYDWAGFDEYEDHGFGDAVLALKLLYPSGYKDPIFTQAYLLRATLPTGMRNHGVFPRNPYYYHSKTFYSSELPNVNPMLLWTIDLRRGEKFPMPLVFNLNLGAVFTVHTDRNNTLDLNCSIEYIPVDLFSLFLDFSAESRWENFGTDFDMLRDPVMLSPGLCVRSPGGLLFKLTGDFSLAFNDERTYITDKYEYTTTVAPVYGFQLQVGWNGYILELDKDGDGLKKTSDSCPNEPEDRDGYMDGDGCPDPDNDRDGLPDSVDKCIDKPEDLDGFKDGDGCPDKDNDGDGIVDSLDKCPNQPEDYDGIEDKDGCIDEDNDGDGVMDSLDKCPNQPEDFDRFQDEDGCPDNDNDGDGIDDVKDNCPDKPETMNSYKDEDGCPDTKPEKGKPEKKPEFPRRQILKGVKFGSGEYTVNEKSKDYIDPVIERLKNNKNIEIEVRGHTDRIGSFDANMRLSEKRAESVRQYIIEKGIDPSRITAVGFGPKSPIGDNRTAKGRSMNRRIEIIRLK